MNFDEADLSLDPEVMLHWGSLVADLNGLYEILKK